MASERPTYGGPQLSRQNLFRHGKIILTHGKIILTTAKSFLSRQNHLNQGKIIFNRGEIIFKQGKYILYSRDLCSQGMGVNQLWRNGGQLTRSFETSRRCFAQTVECL